MLGHPVSTRACHVHSKGLHLLSPRNSCYMDICALTKSYDKTGQVTTKGCHTSQTFICIQQSCHLRQPDNVNDVLMQT